MVQWVGTRGIHTRLFYLIKQTGGLDRKKRVKYLREKYGLSDEEIDKVYYYNIESYLVDRTLDEALQEIHKDIKNKEEQAQEECIRLGRLFSALMPYHKNREWYKR